MALRQIDRHDLKDKYGHLEVESCCKLNDILTFKQHEHREAKTETDKQIEKLEEQLLKKNSYFELFKTDLAKTKANDTATLLNSKPTGFDKVFAHYDEKIAGSTKYEDRVLPKITKRGGSCRQDLNTVVCSSQTVGWRKPYDSYAHTNARIDVASRTFVNKGHL